MKIFRSNSPGFWLTKISAHRLFPNFIHQPLMLFCTISSLYPFHAMDSYIPTIHLPHLHSNFFPPLTLLLAKNKVDSHLSRALGKSLECPCAPTCRPTYKLPSHTITSTDNPFGLTRTEQPLMSLLVASPKKKHP